MPIAVQAQVVGHCVAVVRTSWNESDKIKAGSKCVLWVTRAFDEDPIALTVPNLNGWREACDQLDLGDDVVADVVVRPSTGMYGKPTLRYELADLKLRKPQTKTGAPRSSVAA